MSKLCIKHVSMSYQSTQEPIEILHDINMVVNDGESVALIGDNGCGKSQLMRTILHLNRKHRILSGTMTWNNQDITSCTEAQMRRIRHHEIAMIFQDPKMALDPVMTIGKHMMECLSSSMKKQEKRKACEEALHQVHIADPQRILKAYPHELSIGMCQRVMIAMVLLSNASLWICDEATSSLDVSVQAEILHLLKSLQRLHHISMIFITHDKRLIPMMCDRVYVMKQGTIIDSYDASSLLPKESLK